MVDEKEYGETVKEPMEQAPSIVKGEEVEIFRRDSFYYLKGSNEAFSSRYYAEQAARARAVEKAKPKVDAEMKRKQKQADLGLISQKELKKTEKEQREWLEKQ